MDTSSSLSAKNFDSSFIIANLLTYRLFTRIPSIFPKISGPATALSTIYSGIIVLAVIWILTAALSSARCLNITDAAAKAFGKFGKLLVSLFVLFYLAVSATVVLNEFSEFTKLLSFPTAPVAFCAVFFVIAPTFGALSGIDTISRLHKLFVPLVFIVLGIVAISTLWDGDLSNIFPILGKGAKSIFGSGISGTIMYSDIVLIFLVSPQKESPKAVKKNIILSSAIGILTVFAVMFTFNIRIPYPISAEGQFPIYLLLKGIHYGRFFQRIDAILLFVATLSGMLYLSLNLALFTDILSHSFNVSDTKPVLFTSALTLFLVVSGIKLIPPQFLSLLLFASCFSIFAVFILTAFFVKVREKSLNESS